MDKLLPCPLCGKSAQLIDVGSAARNESPKWEIKCPCCWLTLPWYRIKEFAIISWNRRPQLENKPLTVEELREMEGEPVWIARTEDSEDNPPYWAIVGEVDADIISIYSCTKGNHTSLRLYNLGLYNKTWLAHRRKPECVNIAKDDVADENQT